MKGIDFIDYLRKERRLTEYQIGKVKELLPSDMFRLYRPQGKHKPQQDQ